MGIVPTWVKDAVAPQKAVASASVPPPAVVTQLSLGLGNNYSFHMGAFGADAPACEGAVLVGITGWIGDEREQRSGRCSAS